MQLRAPIPRPNILWRAFVIGGVTGMAVLSYSDEAWEWWEERVTDKIPRDAVRGLLRGTLMVHMAEARFARHRARAAGIDHPQAWFRTTLMYGFPQLGLLRKEIGKADADEVLDAVVNELARAA